MPAKRAGVMVPLGPGKRRSSRIRDQQQGRDISSSSTHPIHIELSDSTYDSTEHISNETPRALGNLAVKTNPSDSFGSEHTGSGNLVDSEESSGHEEAEDRFRFRGRAAELKYLNNFCKRPVLSERGIKLVDFAGPPYELVTLFEERQWQQWATARRTAIVPLVREFYANAQVFRENNEYYIEAKVRGKIIIVDFELIASVSALPAGRVCDITMAQEREWKEKLKKENLVKVLTGNPQAVWVGARISKTVLTLKSLVLHMFVCSSLLPYASRSTVTMEQALLIGKILLNIPYNLAYHIWLVIAKAVKKPESNSGLPFGGLITEILLQAGVEEEVGMEIVKPTTLIDLLSVKRSQGQMRKKRAERTDEDQPEVRGEEGTSTVQSLKEKVDLIQKNQEILMNKVEELKSGQQEIIQMLKRISHGDPSGDA